VQLGLPAGLQAAGDQPVLGLTGGERPFGAGGLVDGPLDGELGGAGGSRPAVGDLIGSVNLLTEAVALGKPPQLIKLTETVELEKSPR
jgi:hypothetical protein